MHITLYKNEWLPLSFYLPMLLQMVISLILFLIQ